ncbi:MAG: AIR synthase-related protein, partial [Gammaproteobacteria bacterium]
PVFAWLQRTAGIDDAEMFRTFNCGIGMTVHVAATDADAVMARLRALGESPRLIGELRAGVEGVRYV